MKDLSRKKKKKKKKKAFLRGNPFFCAQSSLRRICFLFDYAFDPYVNNACLCLKKRRCVQNISKMDALSVSVLPSARASANAVKLQA